MPVTEIGGTSLYFEISGNMRGPLLVLANSLGSSLRMWDKVLPAFERGYRVLRFDMRGHGKSTLSPEPFKIEHLAHDVLHLLDTVETDRAHICGLSLGGLVALWLGINAPERINGLVLANTAARIGSRDMWDQRIVSAREAGMESLAVTIRERWFTASYRADHPEEMEQIRQMIVATDPDGYAACCEVLRDTDLRDHAHLVEAPTLVITGTHDPATPPIEGRTLHAAMAHSTYLELNASHLSAWEGSSQFGEAVSQHLAAGEAVNG